MIFLALFYEQLFRKYFWRVYNKGTNQLSFFVDGKDVRKERFLHIVIDLLLYIFSCFNVRLIITHYVDVIAG